MLKRMFAIVLMLIGLGLTGIALFGAMMLAFPPVKLPPGAQPDCCSQYAPLLLLIPFAVLFAFGYSARCLWRGYYPAWNTNLRTKLLITAHAIAVLVSLAVLWIWVVGVLLA